MKIGKFKQNKDVDPFGVKEGEFGDLGDFSYRLSWTEDSFMPEAGQKETIGRSFVFNRVYLIGAVMLFFLFFILARTAWLQIIKGDYYYMMAEGNRIRIERLEANRGIIYDRRGNPLVRNVANFLLYFIPSDLPEPGDELDNIINSISRTLGDQSAEDIKKTLKKAPLGSLKSYQPLFVADNIAYEKAMRLYLESANWPGVILSNKTRREYNLCDNAEEAEQCVYSLSHILGYAGKISEIELDQVGDDYLPIDYIGKTGIESFWEAKLRGINGKKQVEVNALGKEKKIISQLEAEDGHNLVLSIDSDLQKKLEEIITSSLDRLNLSKGVAVVLDPNNGEVLAMVSMPAYNINSFAEGISTEEYSRLINDVNLPLFNRAVSGEYPSGSTIKPVIAAAALEEGIITEHTSFLSTGGIRIGQWFFPDWRAGGHGITDVRRALAESVNTFFYYIGGGYQDFRGLGVDRIIHYGKLFGLGTQVGIDLPSEAGGFLPSKKWKEEVKGERWYIGDTYHISIGQGDILATPLQVAVFTSLFANGSHLYRPHLVRQILNSEDEIIDDIEAEVIRNDFIDSYNINIVRQGMRQAVTSGSARSLSTLPVSAAGKTGTAQWSTKKPPHSWFTGFAPYDDPQIVITVLIEEGAEGSSTAVPIAKEVLEWYFQDKN